jgi:hypothetical protein
VLLPFLITEIELTFCNARDERLTCDSRVWRVMIAQSPVALYCPTKPFDNWCRKFGQQYAKQLRRRRAQTGDKWHLDEVFLKITAISPNGTIANLCDRRVLAFDAHDVAANSG